MDKLMVFLKDWLSEVNKEKESLVTSQARKEANHHYEAIDVSS